MRSSVLSYRLFRSMRDKSQRQNMSDTEDGGMGAEDVNVTQIGSKNEVRIQKTDMRDVNINIILNAQQAAQANGGVLGNLLSRVMNSCRGRKDEKRSPKGCTRREEELPQEIGSVPIESGAYEKTCTHMGTCPVLRMAVWGRRT
ncbi:uncharacterized protein LOC124280586 [Haliotis rubra]|uniref:uncharacterized protein LOC124280586 n=1 Tax=Haliotis rubra TaxID=36100 RepID=UPI001EE50CA7|nr:uncharacterized protein LOC124280586 [Haliotis rubra]XP_046572529.1 uncharacterized protein LOC124280586 [Haliotis rubra]